MDGEGERRRRRRGERERESTVDNAEEEMGRDWMGREGESSSSLSLVKDRYCNSAEINRGKI